MSHLSIPEFKALLRSSPLEQVTQSYVFGGLPYYFRTNPEDYDLMRTLLAKGLGLSAERFTVVGSGKTGFSLDPKNPFLPCHAKSDIDVVIVDAEMFDKFWYNLLAWAYPLQGRMGTHDKDWWYTHKNALCLGYAYPGLRIPRSPALPQLVQPIRELYSLWKTAFLNLGRYNSFLGVTIDGRLYRTWNHAMAYHVDGLRELRGLL
jgi:hypothetical protein